MNLDRPTIKHLLEDARDSLRRGEVEDAVALLERIEATSVGLEGTELLGVDDWRDLGAAFRDAARSDDSARAWRRAAELGLPEWVAKTEILIARLVAGDFEGVSERAERLVEARPKNWVARNVRAAALMEEGREREALDEWRAAAKLSGHKLCPIATEHTHLALGVMAMERFLARREDEMAEVGRTEDFELGDKAGTLSARKRWKVVYRLLLQDRPGEALARLDATEPMGEQAEEASTIMLRVDALGELGRWSEARPIVAELVERDPGEPMLVTHLAYCLTRTGDVDMALELLRGVEPAGPDDYFANYYRGCAWLAKGDRARVLNSFRIAFADYFFDTYHSIVVPKWKKVKRYVAEGAVAESDSGRAASSRVAH